MRCHKSAGALACSVSEDWTLVEGTPDAPSCTIDTIESLVSNIWLAADTLLAGLGELLVTPGTELAGGT